MKKRDKFLLDMISRTYTEKNNEILEVLKKHKLPNEFIHALYALDVNRMKKTYEKFKQDFNPNMADFSYCFSWYKPTYRNLPKFILEIALETETDAIIELLLSTECDVNILNSKTGDPLYYLAFEKKYSKFKGRLLNHANFFVKNYRAQSILFYLVNLYVSIYDENDIDSKQEAQVIVDDFRAIITKNPLLITHRDQENCTFTEMIITFEPNNYQKALIFLKETSGLILRMIDEKNYETFQQMIYQSYGFVLMNSFIFKSDENESTSQNLSITNAVNFKNFIIDNDMKDLIVRMETFENNFSHKIYEFNAVIKVGDLEGVKRYLKTDGNEFLIESRDYSGRSCLHLAVLFGQPNIAS